MTILAEGTQGHLTGAALSRFGLASDNPQVWALGVKEVWRVAKPLDRVIHTMGWPLRAGRKYREFGGSFIYPLGDDMVTIGMVVGLDYRDTALSVHDLLQELKTHPRVRRILEGGERSAVGCEDDSRGRLRRAAARFHAPGLLLVRRRRRARQRAGAEGDSLRDRVGAAGGGGGVASRLLWVRRLARRWRHTTRRCARRSSGATCARCGTCGRRSGRASASVARSRASMTATKGKFPPGPMATERDAEPDAHLDAARRRRIRAGRDAHLRQARRCLRVRQPDARRPAEPHRVRDGVPRELGGAVGAHVPGAGVRGRRARATGPSTCKLAPSNCVQCGAITAKGGRLTPPEGGSAPSTRSRDVARHRPVTAAAPRAPARLPGRVSQNARSSSSASSGDEPNRLSRSSRAESRECERSIPIAASRSSSSHVSRAVAADPGARAGSRRCSEGVQQHGDRSGELTRSSTACRSSG